MVCAQRSLERDLWRCRKLRILHMESFECSLAAQCKNRIEIREVLCSAHSE